MATSTLELYSPSFFRIVDGHPNPNQSMSKNGLVAQVGHLVLACLEIVCNLSNLFWILELIFLNFDDV